MKDSMAKLGIDAKIGSPQDFAQVHRRGNPALDRVVKATGVKLE